MNIFKKLLSGLERKYKIYSCLAPLTMIGEVLMETAIPLMMAKIIDVGIAERNLSYVIKAGLIMVLMAIVSLAFGMLGARFGAVAALGFSRNLRRRLFSKIQTFSFGNIDRFSTSSLITRLTTDVNNLQNTYQMLVRICFRAPFMLISGIALSCFISLRLSGIFAVSVPLLAVCLVLIAVTAYPRFRKMLECYDGLNLTVQENLTAIRVVKSFVRRDYENSKFDSSASSLRDAQVNAEKVVILNAPIMQLVVYSCIIAALWFGGNMIITGHLKTGQLVSFLSYIGQILMSLMMLSMIFITMVLSRASIQRIIEVLDEEAEIRNPEDKSKTYYKVANGTIDFKNVSFSYSSDKSKAVLNDINLHIESGQMVGIIGGTGSSKTTLISLIPRLYDAFQGSVSVAGVDVRKYDLKSLRDSVAIVLQKNLLFSGSISDNLRWGKMDASDEEIRQACIASDADEFIRTLPAGYNTELGQGGVNLSGGQKQRLCIARALLKNPAILILDDSTSAVDTATDARIRKALRNSLPYTTKLIIAQRISSVKDADMIIVMDKGSVSGIGSHQQLLAENKIYREVYESQQSQN
ncbi:ABC transporter ATP-binding protein [Treponema sp.]|uniref:ABC transporter ATP-binding protein n=1 Tax=Treponema sp. TaxID=166 RepID=UPI0025DDC2E1|nr:ABC transporter ATP-binding protein [Treponema sp.]MCR5217107.1 ABC transporter ATP-binding protein/permease [Treponema sp.]